MTHSHMDSEPRLLQTKLLVPRVHPDLVARPRLIARLDEGRSRKLTLISAPAGFGKTTLLSRWIAEHNPSIADPQALVAWVSLDERDNDPTRFWTYAIAALQRVWPDVGRTPSAMLRSPQPPPIDAVLTELINDMADKTEETILILDDYQAVDDKAIHQGMGFLIEHLPQTLHLILSTRTDPPLPLARLRAQRQILEVRASDLRFTPEEAETFFQQVAGTSLTSADVAALESLTEGWVAGLQLAALSLAEVEDVAAFLASFSGGQRYVYDYLAHEVLNRQPPAMRTFLQQTAILDRLTASLCDAVVGLSDGQARLEQLERQNLFIVSLDQRRHWYRYHHLFGEFLHTQLVKTASPDVITDLHDRASAWFEANGFIQDAIQHALAAEDFEHARSMIAAHAETMFLRSELRTLSDWLEALPPAFLDDDPFLNTAMAWTLLATGQIEGVEPRLQAVERKVGVQAENVEAVQRLSRGDRGALAEVLCIRTSLAFNQMDLSRMTALAQQVRTYLEEEDVDGSFNTNLALRGVIAFDLALGHEYGGETSAAIQAFEEAIDLTRADGNIHLLPLCISHLAQLQVLCGDLHAAMQVYERGLRIAEGEAPSPLSGMAYTGAAQVLYEWNELEEAASYLEQGLALGQPWSQWEILWAGYTGLADIDWVQGHPERARARLQTLTAQVQRLGMQWAVPAVEAHRAVLAVRLGDREAASRWAATSGLRADRPIPYPQEPYALILARVKLLQGEYAKAAGLVNRLLEGNERAKRTGRVIALLTLRALIDEARGHREAALTALTRALTLGEPEGYVRTFVDEGPALRDLLRHVDEPSGYVAALLDAFDDRRATPVAPEAPSRAPSPLAEPLTDRELDVLALIAQGLTNREIADQLVISINTVKTHGKHLYDKLDVRNRAEAATRAIELDLL